MKNTIKKLIVKNNLFRNKRGQVWAIDLSISLVLFIGVIFLFYNFSISFAPEDPLVNKMIAEGGYASGALVSTGYPYNWSFTTIDQTYSFGLLDDRGFLDPMKLSNFSTWVGNTTLLNVANYSLSKRKINTRYNYYINFSDENLADIGWDFNGENPKQIVKIQRIILYNDTISDPSSYLIKPIKLNLYLWTNESA